MRRLGCDVHRLDKIEGPPRHAATATFFGTGIKLPAIASGVGCAIRTAL
jgi:hypothetical protein